MTNEFPAAAASPDGSFHKPSVDPVSLHHGNLVGGEFWRSIPAYAGISEEQFRDHVWQAKNSITRVPQLLAALQGLVSGAFLADVTEGFRRAPMAIRVSPYVLSLIDWNAAFEDPLRTQFIPLGSRLKPDHPKLGLDSLHERADMPVPGLTHRYPDKALFLALDTCPVYCRFCTRSYAVGLDTDEVQKFHLRATPDRWRLVFDYVRGRPELEDIVISGGDAYQLRPDQITLLGETLLAMPNIRRIRYATKGPAVMPQKLLTDDAWVDALTRVVELGRRQHKDVVLHTHFNHPNEVTEITRAALNRLFERGIVVRNQSVLQHGVNDSAETMKLLVKRLGHINVRPYYVYLHDLVQGVEDLRTSLQAALDLEKHVRGSTAGFNCPTFVVDAPGGGGKRDAHSFEHYDRTTGISVYASPAVHPGELYLYFDPIDTLTPETRARWTDPAEQEAMIGDALREARREA